jgi:hypothetical protein
MLATTLVFFALQATPDKEAVVEREGSLFTLPQRSRLVCARSMSTHVGFIMFSVNWTEIVLCTGVAFASAGRAAAGWPSGCLCVQHTSWGWLCMAGSTGSTFCAVQPCASVRPAL